MNTDQKGQKATALASHRIGLTIHTLFWLAISVFIIFAVDLKTGLILFASFGITVIVNIIVYCATLHKTTVAVTVRFSMSMKYEVR